METCNYCEASRLWPRGEEGGTTGCVGLVPHAVIRPKTRARYKDTWKQKLKLRSENKRKGISFSLHEKRDSVIKNQLNPHKEGCSNKLY